MRFRLSKLQESDAKAEKIRAKELKKRLKDRYKDNNKMLHH